MAKFAPTAPIHILEQLSDKGYLGNYHLLLAHDIMAPDKGTRYKKLFQDNAPLGGWDTIILDNGVAEFGESVSVEIIKEAASYVRAGHGEFPIVLPDVYLKSEETIASCKKALEEWPKHFPEDQKFMIVPQGKTFEEFAACAECFKDDKQISFWGIPRNIVEYVGSRVKPVQICCALNARRHIHMLGFSEDIVDDVTTAKFQRAVRGIDSSVPVRASHHSLPMSMVMPLPPRKETKWWDEGTVTDLTCDNIRAINKWVA